MSNKDKIKEVSLKLFNKYGIEATSTRMITEAAGISNGALFHHFKSKNDIVIEIYKEFKQDLIKYIYEYLKDIKSVRNYYYNYFKSSVMWGLINSEAKTFIDMVTNYPAVKSCGDYLAGPELDYMTAFSKKTIEDKDIVVYDYDSLVFNLVYYTDAVIAYLRQKQDVNVEEYIDFNFNAFWRGIVNF